jgi:uncharacterized MAPEG superfamily protein
MTLDLWMLIGACVWGLVHISAASFMFKAQVGNKYTVGPRDEELLPKAIAGRLHRAQTNFFETFPIFAAVVLVVHVAGRAGDLSAVGSVMYLAARVVYLPLYTAGIPWLRSFAWNVATLGIVLVGLQLAVVSAG